MARLFIAVDLDAATRDAAAAIASDVRSQLGVAVRASWVRADRMHLTLEFFGETDPETAQRIVGALATPVCVPPFDLAFRGLGCFPSTGPPRVLWLGITNGLREIARLRDSIQERVAPGKKEGGVFSPHLTLARFRDRVNRREIQEILRIPAAAGPSRIDHATLYESRLSPRGPTYTRIAGVRLGL